MPNTTVRDDPDHERYIIEVDGELAGFTVYHVRAGDKYFFVHTEIFDDYVGTGIGKILVKETLDDMRRRALTIVPLCPYVWGFIQKNPEYQEIVDHEIFDRIADRLHT